MIDYESFKKAICRISIRSQQKLGGGNQDLLEKKLKEETELRNEKLKNKERIIN